jgi:hypothetical protein
LPSFEQKKNLHPKTISIVGRQSCSFECLLLLAAGSYFTRQRENRIDFAERYFAGDAAGTGAAAQ